MSTEVLERLETELREVRRLVAQLGSRVTPAALSLTEVAQMLSCSPRHVTKLVREGLLTPRDIGGMRRIPVSEVHKLLEAPTMKSSGATPERVKYDGAAALKRLDELTKKKR
jgi:excisionase family DNA binding protein